MSRVGGPTESLRLIARKLSRNAVAPESSDASAQPDNDAASAESCPLFFNIVSAVWSVS